MRYRERRLANAGLGVCGVVSILRSEQPVPDGQDEPVVRVPMVGLSGVMDPMRLWRDQHETERTETKPKIRVDKEQPPGHQRAHR